MYTNIYISISLGLSVGILSNIKKYMYTKNSKHNVHI